MNNKYTTNISAVITMHNGIGIISKTLESMVNQTYKLNEVIVVDDCSTDNSYEFVSNYYSWVRLYKTKKNSGPGAARNLGASVSSNSIVLFLDHDIRLNKYLVNNLMSAHCKYSQYSIYVPRILYSNKPDIIQSEGTDVHFLGISLLSPNSGNSINHSKCINRELLAFGGGCYLIDYKRCSKKIFYDESLFYTLEDTDFSIANARAGNKAMFVSSAQVLHNTGTTIGLSHTNGKKYPGKRLELLIRNRLVLIFKHFSLSFLLKMAPASLIFDLSLLIFSIIKSDDKLAPFKAHYKLLHMLKRIIRYRKNTKDYPFTNQLRNQLQLTLYIKPETYRGKATEPIFYMLNYFLRIYGRYILGIKN